MKHQWKSEGLFEHPAKHQAGTFGKIVLSEAGVYCLQVGGGVMSCPQQWAARIHAEETRQTPAAFLIRHMPDNLRNELKAMAAMRNTNMQELALEFIAEGMKGVKK